MNSRLNLIRNLSELAKAVSYNCAKLAVCCGVSPDHFRRWFHATSGKNLKQWLREQRLKDAPDLLDHEHQVKEAAYKLGYKHPSHFSRDFKRMYGVPPTGHRSSSPPPP